MGLTKHERAEARQRAKEALERYAATHSEAELKRHVAAQRYPSGRWSHGGANRSSNIKREINLHVTLVTLCPSCGGASAQTGALTSLYSHCSCPPPP